MLVLKKKSLPPETVSEPFPCPENSPVPSPPTRRRAYAGLATTSLELKAEDFPAILEEGCSLQTYQKGSRLKPRPDLSPTGSGPRQQL